MSRFRVLAFALVAVTCGGSRVLMYSPKTDMGIHESRETIEELMMTQHRAWRPDYVESNENYIVWGTGVISHTGAWTGTTTRTRSTGERIYYKHVDHLELLSWKRKSKQWYVVRVVRKENRGEKRRRKKNRGEERRRKERERKPSERRKKQV